MSGEGRGSRASVGWHSRKPSTASHLGSYTDTYQDTYPNGPPQGGMNGTARLPRHRTTPSQQLRDAEEFELEGLMSEPETDDGNNNSPTSSGSGSGRKKESSTAAEGGLV